MWLILHPAVFDEKSAIWRRSKKGMLERLASHAKPDYTAASFPR
jgi:hypothetical protein